MAETMKKQELSAAHQELVKAEMGARGVRFLPKQVIARLIDPKSPVQTLGSARRHKAALEAKRAALAKTPATMAPKEKTSKAAKTAAKSGGRK